MERFFWLNITYNNSYPITHEFDFSINKNNIRTLKYNEERTGYIEYTFALNNVVNIQINKNKFIEKKYLKRYNWNIIGKGEVKWKKNRMD